MGDKPSSLNNLPYGSGITNSNSPNNDGIKNLRLKNGTPLPDGFSLGRIKWK